MSIGGPGSSAGRLSLTAVSLVLAALITGVLIVGRAGSVAAPVAGVLGSTASRASVAANDPAARGGTASLQNPASQAPARVSTAVPTRILIPTIHVDAPLQRLATDSKGVLQPPDNWTSAGWYARGVVPGDVGPAVIAGHLDTTVRAAVFVALRFLRPGDPITVEMSDHRVVHFVVTNSAVVKKAFFPTSAVYGPTPDPQLRLITCSEPFSDAQGIYADNLVVFATEKST